ncbi:MAG: hypothetical protein P8R42_09775 [Candidatus Binatia bacterium]|nr:hypothetical protein [Candidatus Binatia bacterium]
METDKQQEAQQAELADATLRALDLVHPGDRDLASAAAYSADANKRLDLTFWIVGPDGTLRWVNAREGIATRPGTSGRHVSGVMRDGTKQVTELRDSEALFHLMAESSPFAVWPAGLDLGCSYVNSEFLRSPVALSRRCSGPGGSS